MMSAPRPPRIVDDGGFQNKEFCLTKDSRLGDASQMLPDTSLYTHGEQLDAFGRACRFN
jgi:hypothetical protein